MKGKLVLIAIVLAVLVLDVSAQKQRKLKRGKKLRTSTETPEYSNESNESRQPERDERIAEQKYHDKERLRVLALTNMPTSEPPTNYEPLDPCSQMHCSAGRICELNDMGEAECNCIKECPFEEDERRKVCTLVHNETWNSDCEVHQQRCLCLTKQEGCKGPEYSHVQVDYFGACRQMPDCTVEEMADFPRRMRDWLFNIMRDLADRRELSNHYLEMEREAESNLTRRWTNAAIWKWCDLDAVDNDRFVTRHELFPIRAPLMSLEHCIEPFLNSCDVDADHRITLTEWGKCLQLEEDDLEDRCDDFNEMNG